MHPPIELVLNEDKNAFTGINKGNKSIRDPPMLVYDSKMTEK